LQDWLTSKTAVIIAAVVILGIMVGFFIYKIADLEEQSLDDEASGMAQYINDITSKDAAIRMHFTFSRDSAGYELPATINGGRYSIEISPYQVVVEQDGARAIAELLQPVHMFYPPQSTSIDRDDLIRADLLVDNFSIRSGQDFWVENRLYHCPGEDYLTFCYIGEAPEELANLSELSDWITRFGQFDMSNGSLLNMTASRTVGYELHMASNVLVARGNLVAFTTIEHLWKPGPEYTVKQADLNATDLLNIKLVVQSGGELVLERRHMRFTDTFLADGSNAESVELFAYTRNLNVESNRNSNLGYPEFDEAASIHLMSNSGYTGGLA